MTAELSDYYLQEMGIERWVKRHQTDFQQAAEEASLTSLQRRVSQCEACPLHKTRAQTVFARGNPTAKLMIVGEAPGFYEDKQGLPFVGKAGKLLNLMLQSISLTENDVYIANVLKCRPPENRDPKEDEIEQCSQYLKEQISLISPHLLVGLGRFSGQFLAGKKWPLNQLREGRHGYQGIPCVVTYHPAYLLRNPRDKKKAYNDFLMMKQLLLSLQSC